MPTDSPRVYQHPGPNAAWLAGWDEDALDPALPIADPHHHLWNRSGDRYVHDGWLADTGSGHNSTLDADSVAGKMHEVPINDFYDSNVASCRTAACRTRCMCGR
jgi:hypothetical protein